MDEVEVDEGWSRVFGSGRALFFVVEKVEPFALLVRKARESHM